MGIRFSCPFATYSDLENGLESIIVNSISLGDDHARTPRRSISFKAHDLQPQIIKSLGSGKMVVEGSISFKRREKESMVSISISPLEQKQDVGNPKHEAALKLQKVYKSFRTRRKLADCAVLVEQSWWKLLDFAQLKHSSISFFDIEHHETAISRWSRAKTRAAKVGKGLSKNDKGRKLALQHWLEAIDPRHRYGHNLHFYYDKWLQSHSREPFFYWLDIGEGREVNIAEKCPRSVLQQQCIKYLGPMERKAYEIAVENGKFFYQQTGELLNTSSDPHSKWIFVLSTSKALYVGRKKKGTFQHSSFLAGGATSAAGRLVVEDGILKAVWPHSGHYKPTPENFQDFISFLREHNVDLTDVKLMQMDPIDDDEKSLNKQTSSRHLRCNSSEEELSPENCMDTADTNIGDSNRVKTDEEDQLSCGKPISRKFAILSLKPTKLEIPNQNSYSWQRMSNLNVQEPNSGTGLAMKGGIGSEEEDDKILKQDLWDEEGRVNDEETIPEECILRRINSHKETKSYQLGKQLSCKWSTGAGPRIGCVRDYPCELQFRALEQVNLSPRSCNQIRSAFSPRCFMRSSPRASTPKPIIISQRSIHIQMQHPIPSAHCSPLSKESRPLYSC